MRIVELNAQPLTEIPFLNAGRGAGDFYEDRLPILHGSAVGLPDGVDGLLITSDLQGRERFQESNGGPIRLLGEVLPERLRRDILPAFDLPDSLRMGVVLAGDLYTVPALDRRGGTGDVTEVWRAFGDQFSWVVGVAGNHDSFGPHEQAAPKFSDPLHFLDAGTVTLGGVRFSGLGGIIGNPRRHQRRSQDDYLQALLDLLAESPDVLILHDGPDAPQQKLRGSPLVREVLETQPPSLTIRGHAHWRTPLAELPNGVQVLNVDARVVVLTRA